MKGPEDRQFAKFRLTGSPRALGAVYDLVAPELLRVAAHLVSDPSAAEDLVQRTFVTAIEKSHGFRDEERVLPWLLGILAFHAKNEKRRASRRPDPARLHGPTVSRPDGDAESMELDAHLTQALAKLPEEQRSVLTLRLRHNLSAAQIASALGRPAGTVRSQLARGMESLRDLLPAGLVASAIVAFGLPHGMAAVREGLVQHAVATPLPKLVAAKGYCSLALASIAEVLLMKQGIVAAVVLVAALMGVRALVGNGERPTAPALKPVAEERELPNAVRPRAQTTPPKQATEKARLAIVEDKGTPAAPQAGTTVATQQASTGALELRVCNPVGEVVADEVCVVEFTKPFSTRLESHSTRTNRLGIARFPDLPAYQVHVQALRGAMQPVAVRPKTTTRIELTLPAGIEVRGQVVDVRGDPVPHASVWLSKPSSSREGFEVMRADGNGRFQMKSVSRHNYVGALAKGFAISYLQAPRGVEGQSVEMRIVLESAGSAVEIHVADSRGQPVTGAEVLIGDQEEVPFRDLGNGSSGPPPPPQRGRTDASGRLTLDSIPLGTLPVWVRAGSYGVDQAEVVVRANVTSIHQVTLQEPARISGRVTTPEGAPLPSVSLWTGTAHRFESTRAYTDSEGRYQMNGLPGGEVHIHASLSGVGATERQVTLLPGKWQELNLILQQQPRIHGVLVDAEGRPLADHTLVTRHEATRALVSTSRATSAGAFCLLVDPDETYSVMVRRAGDWSAFPLLVVKGLKASEDPLRLQVPKESIETARLRLEVQGPDGLPLDGAALHIFHRDLNLRRSYEATDAGGLYELKGLVPGQIELTVRHGDYQMLKLDAIELHAGDRVDLGTKAFAPACGIVGGFHGLKDINLLASAEIRISQPGGAHGYIQIVGDRFMSSPLAPGTHLLSFLGDNFTPIYKNIELKAGEQLDLTLELIPAGLHLVQVQPAEGDPQPLWVGAQVFSSDGAFAWSGAASKQADGSFLARISVLPGSYRLNAESNDGREASLTFDVIGIDQKALTSSLELSRLEE